MIPYIKKYGEEKTRRTVLAALYIATGKEGRRPFRTSEIRRYFLDFARGCDESGSISPQMVNRMLEPINGEVLESADRERGVYRLKDISLNRPLLLSGD